MDALILLDCFIVIISTNVIVVVVDVVDVVDVVVICVGSSIYV